MAKKRSRQVRKDADSVVSRLIGRMPKVWSPPENWFPEIEKIVGEHEDLQKPLADFCVSETNFTLELEMPGVDRKSIRLSAHHGGLEVEAMRSDAFKEEGGKGVCFSERHYPGFYRFVSMPQEADLPKAGAEYKDGILSITIPKKKAPKQPTTPISVK